MDLRVDVRGGGEGGEAAFALLVERWIGEGVERRAVLEPVRSLICGPALEMAEEDVAIAFGPVRTVLERGMDGIPVTGAGAFEAAFARELAASHPEWAGIDVGRVHREADLPMLRNLRATLLEGGHLVLDERVVFASPDTAELARAEPAAAAVMLGCELVREATFIAEAAELAGAHLLAGVPLDVERLASRSVPAIRERWDGGPIGGPVEDAIRIAISIWVDHARAIGVLPDPWATRLRGDSRWPGPVGSLTRACLMAMLRYRVVRFVETAGGGD